jgi:hypothetical protein
VRLLAALVLLGLAAAPAQAVVGGKRVAASAVPWFADIGGCGGTLVAPDRLVTAAHCVIGSSPDRLDRIRVAGTTRKGVRFALHPEWRRGNGRNVLDDVALIQLDAPVTTVAPVALGGAPPERVTVLGRGASRSNQRGAGLLREAVLRPVTDRDCGLFFGRSRGNDGERFSAARMLCATDVNGRRPLSSACVGDSGGPLYTGPKTAPVLVGIVSFGGDRCGADRLPNVFAEVAVYAGFITNPAPVWAPVATGPSRVSGTGRVGRRLTCAVPGWEGAPDRVSFQWLRVAGRRVRTVGRGATYRLRRADAGRGVVCVAEARNAGGIASAPVGEQSGVLVRR